MPKHLLTLSEGDSAEIVLSTDEYRALAAGPLVDVIPTLKDDRYVVSAQRNKVGAVSFGARQIVVRPKITDLNRLVFLLGYSRRPDIWQNEPVHLESADELFPALAETFSRLATRATDQGLLQGYRAVDDSLPVLRGRLLAGEQMTRHFGFRVPLAVEYDDFTTDIAENQILLAATLRMLTIPGVSADARRRLQRLRVVLADVTPPLRGSRIPLWHPTRLNARYRDALRLAEVILAAQSFEHHVGTLSVSGYVFDMWRVFEDFICTALGEAIRRTGERAVTQRAVFLDTSDRVRMKPDLIWIGPGGDVRAVVDAKYKAERPDGFPDADIYQMLAYCTALDLAEGHLICQGTVGTAQWRT